MNETREFILILGHIPDNPEATSLPLQGSGGPQRGVVLSKGGRRYQGSKSLCSNLTNQSACRGGYHGNRKLGQLSKPEVLNQKSPALYIYYLLYKIKVRVNNSPYIFSTIYNFDIVIT